MFVNYISFYMKRPNINEYNPYFQQYIDLVPYDDFYLLFKNDTSQTLNFFKNLSEEKHNYAYAENKWTIKQVFMHLIDTERVFSYRALVAARGDKTTQLQSFDDNLYAKNAAGNNRSMDSLLEEFAVVRRGTEIIFENITEEQSRFEGNAIMHSITARALGFIIIGHTHHHLNVIKERYL